MLLLGIALRQLNEPHANHLNPWIGLLSTPASCGLDDRRIEPGRRHRCNRLVAWTIDGSSQGRDTGEAHRIPLDIVAEATRHGCCETAPSIPEYAVADATSDTVTDPTSEIRDPRSDSIIQIKVKL
jgi:hypothetical protein